MAQRATGPTAIDIGGGKLGFRDENLPGGVEGTDVLAAWLNSVQEEHLAPIEAAGLVPDPANRAQLLEALRFLFGGRIAVFTSSGTYTPRAGLTSVIAVGWAGGGRGGGSNATGAGGGGSGGGFGLSLCPVTPGVGVAVTVGAGDSGAGAGGSSFGSLLALTGGLPGSDGSGTGGAGAGAAGSATAADWFVGGRSGVNGVILAGTSYGGPGGHAMFGSMTHIPIGSGGGARGTYPGGGGSGAAAGPASGGNGADGLVLVIG